MTKVSDARVKSESTNRRYNTELRAHRSPRYDRNGRRSARDRYLIDQKKELRPSARTRKAIVRKPASGLSNKRDIDKRSPP